MRQSPSPCFSKEEIELLWNLIRAHASLHPIRRLLKERGLPYSASGDALFQDQVLPALLPPAPAEAAETTAEEQRPALTERDLIDLLRDHEEYGPQHVFLYRCDPRRACRLLSEGRLREKLQERQQLGLLDCPRVLDKPASPCLTDVRLENTNEPTSLTVKAVEKRIYQLRQRPDPFTVVITEEEERAVNLFRLRADGLLELRIQSFRGADSYRTSQARMWGLAADLLPFDDFQPVDLVPLRRHLWDRRSRLVDRLRFRLLRLRTNVGTVVTFVTGNRDDNLAADVAAVKAINEILRKDGSIDELNAYWLADGARRPTREVHMQLTGQLNEFVIAGHCSKSNYRYVLERVTADRR